MSPKSTVFYRIVRFSQRHSTAVILLTFAITLAFVFSASGIKLNADYNSLLPFDGQALDISEEFTEGGQASDNIIVTFRSDDPYRPEVLERLQDVALQIEAFENVAVGTHPFSMVTAEKKGSRLVIVPISPVEDGGQWDESSSALLKQRLLDDMVTENLVVSSDGTMILMYFPVLGLSEDNAAQYAAIKEIVEPLQAFGTVKLSGTVAITERITFFLVRDLVTLLGISFVVIMLVYYLSFRAKRSVLLPLSVVVFGVIWTLGIMRLLGYELTIFNIITPPLVLTLGSSYSIHMLNEYFKTERSTAEDDTDKQWIAEAVFHINKTIILACITSVAGFLSLLVTKIEQFREFGISTAIGISVCALLTLFYLPAFLHQLSEPKKQQTRQVREGGITKIVAWVGGVVINHWGYILVFFLALIAAFVITFPNISFETNYNKYFSADDPLVVDSDEFIRNIGGVDSMYATLMAPEGSEDYFLDPEVLGAVNAFEEAVLAATEDVTHLVSFSSYVKFLDGVMDSEPSIPESSGLIMLLSRYLSLISGMDENNRDLQMLINEQKDQLTIVFRYRDSANLTSSGLENTQGVIDAIASSAELLPEGVEVVTWGNGKRFIDLSDLIQQDQRRSTLASIIVVFLITAITFRSFGYGFFSIIPIAVGIMANYIFMVLFDIPFDMITMGFSSVTVGVGIDDAIHFIIRFREQYSSGKMGLKEAIETTIVHTGRPITLTSVSIISGLMVLSLASFMPVRYFGVLISIALFNTLIATLFILPALMYGGLGFIERRRARG